MDFTAWFKLLTTLGDAAKILGGLGLVTVLLAYLKHTADRRAWRDFKTRAHDLAGRLLEAGNRHPLFHMDDEEWQAECERMLFDANFSPLQIPAVLDLSVVVAKAIAVETSLSLSPDDAEKEDS